MQLDCTWDKSHREQLTFIIQIVEISIKPKYKLMNIL
jgi:hypothetical protein